MNNIGNYKKRFFNLMESTMGDVKPLIVKDDETVEITTHRESCGQKLIGKQFTFTDVRGLRKEGIKITITEITYDLATQGNIFQHKQNVGQVKILQLLREIMLVREMRNLSLLQNVKKVGSH